MQNDSEESLSGATVWLKGSYLSTFTDSDGSFILKGLPSDSQTIVVSYIGYETQEKSIFPKQGLDLDFYLKSTAVNSEEVIVNATRASASSPATVSNISKEEIEKENLAQDLPFLLKRTPSLIVTSDAGAGVGYTGMRIRGSDASRINVTINGVPLNDAESHGTFWVNMPDFASSLESVQIQRGVGTSTNGAAAFGATVNLQTSTIQPKSFAEINNSYGSFNTKKHTVKFGTGMLNNKFAFEGRLSKINSDGYIDRASSDLQSYFLSGGYYGKKTILKAIAFGGAEKTYQSWYGTPESRIENDTAAMLIHAQNNGLSPEQTENLLSSGRTYNHYLYENQTDNYKQDHYQLHLSQQLSDKFVANASLHYTRGKGYYENFESKRSLKNFLMEPIHIGDTIIDSTDLINRKWLDNHFYGMTYSLIYTSDSRLKFTLGGGYNIYDGNHFGEVIWAEYSSNVQPFDRYYSNKAKKTDFNSYLKIEYSLNEAINLLADFQIRSIDYTVFGYDEKHRLLDIDEQYNFFNPKLGINYQLSQGSSLYAFFGIAHREPNRADLVDQEVGLASEPEELRNLELGYELRKRKYLLAANLYFMDYTNQLVLTGELNNVGTPIKQNVKDSYRTGIEVEAAYNILKNLEIYANATISRNKIDQYQETIYDYSDFPNIAVFKENISETDIAFSPEIIANLEVVYHHTENMEMAISTKYVGDQYLDNTSNENRKLDDYLYTDFRFSYNLNNVLNIKNIELLLQIRNVFNRLYSANGYTYSYIAGDKITENFYYPQAGRNYMLGLNLKF